VTCGRYIMVREAEIHQQTNCEYPDVRQKNETEPSATGFNWTGERNFHHQFPDPFGYTMLHDDFSRHMQEMLENHGGNLSDLQDVFGQMAFRRTRIRDSEFVDPFIGVRLRSPVDNPRPPYLHERNADDTHASDTHILPEERDTLLDHISVGSDNDDDFDDEGKSFSLLFET